MNIWYGKSRQCDDDYICIPSLEQAACSLQQAAVADGGSDGPDSSATVSHSTPSSSCASFPAPYSCVCPVIE